MLINLQITTKTLNILWLQWISSLRVQLLKSKYATSTAEAFKRMIKTKQPKEVWVDKGTGFEGSFKTLFEEKGIKIYRRESEKKFAFAERNIRS